MWIQEGNPWWHIFENPNGEYWCFHRHNMQPCIEFVRASQLSRGMKGYAFSGEYIPDIELSNETWPYQSDKARDEAWDQIKASPIGYYVASMI